MAQHRMSLGGAAPPANKTNALRGRSAFAVQSDEVRRRSGAGVPQLPVRYVCVKPVGGALIYTAEGIPLPDDQWSQVPISPGVIQALRYGDLEAGEEFTQTPEQPQDQQQGSSPEERQARRRREPPPPSLQ